MKILADAALPHVVELFTPSFDLTLYHSQNDVCDLLATHDILLCRSTLNVTAQLLTGSRLQCVATASSGTDHIDCDYLTQHGIPLFDAKGCNARAVADYVVASLAFLYKSGCVLGNQAGIIGVGEVGTQVIARLRAMGFDVRCVDPIREQLDHDNHYCSLAELTSCDLLCIHANLHTTPPYPSVNLLDTELLSQLKPGVVIINAARGGIINEDALLKIDKPITYCTDVYLGEPTINADLVAFSTLCTPHIAGHSIEAKNAAVFKISQQLHRHFGLPMPTIATSRSEPYPLLSTNQEISCSNWQDNVLALYNPLKDTYRLKKATDKTRVFLKQRQAHKNRHDFSFYNATQYDDLTRLLLGHPLN